MKLSYTCHERYYKILSLYPKVFVVSAKSIVFTKMFVFWSAVWLQFSNQMSSRQIALINSFILHLVDNCPWMGASLTENIS